MAIVELSGRWFCPGARTLLGRSAACGITLEDRTVSGEHASLLWRDGRWQLRDLGSSNGTTVDGQPVAPGQPHTLAAGARVRLGSAEWVLSDAGPPGPVTVAPERRLAVDQMLMLPNADAPRVLVYDDGSGGWCLERDGAPQPATPDSTVEVDGVQWRILVPPSDADGPATTWKVDDSARIETVELELVVSQDEEHVEAALRLPGGRESLGSRVHHQLTLLLARARLEDRAAGVAEGEAGWRYVDDAMKMLAADRLLVNQYAFRFRRELAAAGVEGAPRAVERRPQAGSLRIGVRRLVVRRF